MKSIEELNLSFQQSRGIVVQRLDYPFPIFVPSHNKKRRSRKLLIVLTAVIIAIISLLIAVKISGYINWFRVVSGSMEREIPQGSLVISRKIEPSKITIGDVITYIKTDGSTVTHEVIKIDGSGEDISFILKGTENENADPVVYPENIVGKMMIHIPGLGDILSNLRKAAPAIIIGLFAIAAFIVRRVLDSRR